MREGTLGDSANLTGKFPQWNNPGWRPRRAGTGAAHLPAVIRQMWERSPTWRCRRWPRPACRQVERFDISVAEMELKYANVKLIADHTNPQETGRKSPHPGRLDPRFRLLSRRRHHRTQFQHPQRRCQWRRRRHGDEQRQGHGLRQSLCDECRSRSQARRHPHARSRRWNYLEKKDQTNNSTEYSNINANVANTTGNVTAAFVAIGNNAEILHTEVASRISPPADTLGVKRGGRDSRLFPWVSRAGRGTY